MDNHISPILEDISVPAYELRKGMFVSNLDCGWGRTPFLIEGVLLKKQEEIDLIRSVARYVTIDLVRSEDFALQEFLKGESYKRRQLGEIDANTFSSSRAGNSEDIEPLTSDPRDSAVEHSRKAERTSLSALLKAFKLRVLSIGRKKDPEDTRSNFQKGQRPAYLPPDIEIIRYPSTEFSWQAVRVAQQTTRDTIATLAEVTRTIERYRTVDARKISKAAQALAEHMIHFPEAMIWASRLQQKDDELLRRSLQAAIYLTAMGRYLGFPERLLGELAATGLLLDIGKTQIDAKLLGKPGPYNEDEMRSAQRHVNLSLSLLGEADSLSHTIKRAVGEHHEQINGDGYPKGMHGGDISVFGKMAAIVDGYVAMVNPRPYAQTLAPHEAIKQLFAGANTRWFGPLVEQFVQSIGIYPIGSLVELASGHIAIVIQHNRERRLEPKILIVTHSDKRRRFPPLQLDLLKHNARDGNKGLRIKQGLPDGAYGIDVEEFYSKRR